MAPEEEVGKMGITLERSEKKGEPNLVEQVFQSAKNLRTDVGRPEHLVGEKDKQKNPFVG